MTNAYNLTLLFRERDVEAKVSLHLHSKFKKLFFETCCCLNGINSILQFLPSVLSKVAPRSVRKHVLVVLDDCFLTSRTLLSVRFSNVGLSGGCRVRPKFWRLYVYIIGVLLVERLHDLLTHPDCGLCSVVDLHHAVPRM